MRSGCSAMCEAAIVTRKHPRLHAGQLAETKDRLTMPDNCVYRGPIAMVIAIARFLCVTPRRDKVDLQLFAIAADLHETGYTWNPEIPFTQVVRVRFSDLS